MAQLRNNLKEVERELEFHRVQPVADGDRFLPVMKEFLTTATCRFSELEDLFQDMKTRVRIWAVDIRLKNLLPEEILVPKEKDKICGLIVMLMLVVLQIISFFSNSTYAALSDKQIKFVVPKTKQSICFKSLIFFALAANQFRLSC